MKTVNKTEQALLDELDKMIDYSSKAKNGISRIKLNKKQFDIYKNIIDKTVQHYNENAHIPVDSFKYRGVEIYK